MHRQRHDSQWCFTAVCAAAQLTQLFHKEPSPLIDRTGVGFQSTYLTTCYTSVFFLPFINLCLHCLLNTYAYVSKCFISSPPAVHETLPPFTPSAHMDLFTYFTIPLSQSLHLSAVDQESGLQSDFTCTSIRTDENSTGHDRSICQLLHAFMFVCD